MSHQYYVLLLLASDRGHATIIGVAIYTILCHMVHPHEEQYNVSDLFIYGDDMSVVNYAEEMDIKTVAKKHIPLELSYKFGFVILLTNFQPVRLCALGSWNCGLTEGPQLMCVIGDTVSSDGGNWTNFLQTIIFPIFRHYQKRRLFIEYHVQIDWPRHSSAAVISVKHKSDSEHKFFYTKSNFLNR